MTTTTTQANGAATQTGVTLLCPCCHEGEASVSLFLADGSFQCAECDETFEAEQVRALIAGAERWAKVLAWAESMPKV